MNSVIYWMGNKNPPGSRKKMKAEKQNESLARQIRELRIIRSIPHHENVTLAYQKA
jgi:hypothetical protein